MNQRDILLFDEGDPSTKLGTLGSGFTLMELLVVIAIIGILVAVAAFSYIGAQQKSRDSRRISDMKALQNAWEQYYADYLNAYPGPPSPIPCSLDLMISPASYLPAGMPFDPKSGATPTPYLDINSGWSRCSATSYCFCAGLEATRNSEKDCVGNPVPTPAYNGSQTYVGLYCVRNLQ